MTVAELIVKLQEMPQDLPIQRADSEWDCVPLTDVQATVVSTHEWTNIPYFQPIPNTRKETEVVLLS